MKLTEIIFGPENLGKDRRYDALVSLGFSHDEAVRLAWLRNRIEMGKYIGSAIAALTIYGIYKGHKYPLPFINYQLNIPLALAIGAAGIAAGQYYFNANRRGANTYLSNFYTNNNIMASKHDFIQNFELFNRKFTKDEIEQMLFNSKLKVYGRKKYIYNAVIHGDDEDKFKARHQLFNSGKHVITDYIQNDIHEQNVAKIMANEKIVLKPFKVSEHIDPHGSKEHIHKLELFSKQHVL